MNLRSVLAMGVGGMASLGMLLLGGCKPLGVKSHGHPVGRVVRAGQKLCVLMETCDPYMPSLKGVPESSKSYSYALWVFPETCDADARRIPLDGGVRSGARSQALGAQAFDGTTLWYVIEGMTGVDLASGAPTSRAAPPGLANAPISQLLVSEERPLEEYRAQSVKLASGEWLSLASDEERAQLQPGIRLYDNPTAKGTYKARGLYSIVPQAGPIAKIASATPVAGREFRNGAFMRATKGGDVVRFSNPEGFLIVHQDGDPVHPTIRFSRMHADGSIAWSVDTRVGRVIQYLPDERVPALVGDVNLIEPLLTAVDLRSGNAHTKSLKGPTN